MSGINYKDDRNFTDKAHLLAKSIIYPKMNWILKEKENNELEDLKDCVQSVDYEAYDKTGNLIYIQERFREQGGMDFTLRYKREENEDETQKFSEFYKLKSFIKRNKSIDFYMIYGILTEDKTTFKRYAIINLRELYNYIDNKKIIIDSTVLKNTKYKDGIFYPGLNENIDKSSSFIAFDIPLLIEHFDTIICFENGFSKSSRPSNVATEKQINYIKKLSKEKGYFLPDFLSYDMTKTEASILIDFLNNDDLSKNTDIKKFINNKNHSKVILKYLIS